MKASEFSNTQSALTYYVISKYPSTTCFIGVLLLKRSLDRGDFYASASHTARYVFGSMYGAEMGHVVHVQLAVH